MGVSKFVLKLRLYKDEQKSEILYKQNETSYEVSLCLRSLNFWLMVYLIDISSINT